jgi:hypothetical protein
MMPIPRESPAPIPPPAYHRAQARGKGALHIDARALVRCLHLLAICRLAVRLAHRRCSPPLPAGPGGAPRTSSEASLLLVALLRTLWRLSYQDMHDWLKAWPALALACGLPLNQQGCPHIPSPSQQCKRLRPCPGSPSTTALARLSRPYPALSGLRLTAVVPALSCQCPRCPLCPASLAVGCSPVSPSPSHYPSGCGLLGSATDPLDPCCPGRGSRRPLESQTAEEPFLPPSHLDGSGVRQTHLYRALLWPCFPLFSLAASSALWLVSSRYPRCSDVHCLHRRRAGCSSSWTS